MKTLGLMLSAGSALGGLVAAFYWYRSSAASMTPEWPTGDSPGEPGDPHGSLMFANGITTEQGRVTIEAFTKSAERNRKAAIWTAAAVGLGAVGTFLPSFTG
jgi:hypothetical protein